MIRSRCDKDCICGVPLEDPRHKAHDQMLTLSDFERDNLMENLILIVGFERFKKAANCVTGEETLLALCGKELE